MDKLADELLKLVAIACSQRVAVPLDRVRIAEIADGANVDSRGRLRVQRSDLHTMESYEARYKQLMSRGYSWLNLHCAGLDGDELIVTVEMPRESGQCPRTPVNLSGPSNRVVAHGLDAGQDLALY